MNYGRRGNGKQNQEVTEKQLMIHEAHAIDSQRRIISGINGYIHAAENRDEDKMDDELNNLNIQLTVASGIFNDKKYKGKQQDLLKKLKREFMDQIKNVPSSLMQDLDEYLNLYMKCFDKNIDNTIEIKGDTSKPLTTNDVSVMMATLNYSNGLNDEIRKKAETAASAEELTVMEKQEINSMGNETYMTNYDMKAPYKKVYQGYSDLYNEKNIKESKKSNPPYIPKKEELNTNNKSYETKNIDNKQKIAIKESIKKYEHKEETKQEDIKKKVNGSKYNTQKDPKQEDISKKQINEVTDDKKESPKQKNGNQKGHKQEDRKREDHKQPNNNKKEINELKNEKKNSPKHENIDKKDQKQEVYKEEDDKQPDSSKKDNEEKINTPKSDKKESPRKENLNQENNNKKDQKQEVHEEEDHKQEDTTKKDNKQEINTPKSDKKESPRKENLKQDNNNQKDHKEDSNKEDNKGNIDEKNNNNEEGIKQEAPKQEDNIQKDHEEDSSKKDNKEEKVNNMEDKTKLDYDKIEKEIQEDKAKDSTLEKDVITINKETKDNFNDQSQVPSGEDNSSPLKEEVSDSKTDISNSISNEVAEKRVNPKAFFRIKVENEIIGEIIFELWKDKVPKTAENFRCLCTGEKGKGKYCLPLNYKSSRFHKIIYGFACYSGKLSSNVSESIYGPKFDDENLELPTDEEGLLIMDNGKLKDGNDSRFFITLIPCPLLKGTYVPFGKVIKGMEVVKKINELGNGEGVPTKSIIISDCGEIIE